jgi:hypothetical protein
VSRNSVVVVARPRVEWEGRSRESRLIWPRVDDVPPSLFRWINAREVSHEPDLLANFSRMLLSLSERVDRLEDWQRSPVRMTFDGDPVLIRNDVPDAEAIEELRRYLLSRREDESSRVNLLDLMAAVHLPGPQIERLMNKLVGEGVDPVA